MSTNYTRIPKANEVRLKYLDLVERINDLDIWCPDKVSNEFRFVEKGRYATPTQI